jgi:hypothetical protein
MIQTVDVSDIVNMILFLLLGNLTFEVVSHFDIRVSNFKVGRAAVPAGQRSARRPALRSEHISAQQNG